MYDPRRNTYTPLPSSEPPVPSSSFYQHHFPQSSAPPTQRGYNSSILSHESQLSFDIFPNNNASNTTKLKTSQQQERAPLVHERERKKPKYLYLRFIYLICIAEVLVFGYSIYMNGGFETFSKNPMIGPSPSVLLELGANYDQSILEEGQWWRFITAIFLHAGVIHLVCNVLFQLLQGVPLEREFGSIRIFVIYILSGVTGNLMSSIFLPTVLSVGGSGSLFGLLGTMLAALVKNWHILKRPCTSVIFLLIAIFVNLFIGLLPYIDNFAHVGGLIAGILFGLAFVPPSPRRNVCLNTFLAIFGGSCGFIALFVGFVLFYTQFDVHEWCTWCMCIFLFLTFFYILYFVF
jgi:membrane associated rhomboid family serine protease